MLGGQFVSDALNAADEAKLGSGYSVAKVGSSSTATAFTITLGSSNGFTNVANLSSAARTLTFNKGVIVDAAGNPASSHAAFVMATDIIKAAASSTTHISTDVTATDAYATGETIRIVFNEQVDTSKVIMSNLTSTGTLGNSTISAVSESGGYATTFDITVGSTATLASGNTITISSANAVDTSGNTGLGSEISITLPGTTTLKLTSDTIDITSSSLNANINTIDLNGLAATLTVSQAKLTINANGGSYTIFDTAANLVTDRTDGSVTGATAVTSDGSGAALSIADAKLLVAIADFDAANSLWDVEDTAANLIADIADGSVTGAANLDTSDVGSVELSVSEAKSLLGASVTITNGYTVDDTAANLVTDRTDGSVTGATAVTSDGSGAALSIADAKLLVAIADFDAANSLWDVEDTAANLVTDRTDGSVTGAAAVTSDGSGAALSIADAKLLVAIADFDAANSLWDVEDTAANLIADIADGSVTGAANLDTSDVGSVELSVSEAKSLLGASVTITNGYTVDDTAANLVTDRTDGSVTGATAVTSDGSGAALSIVDAKLLVAIADFDAANSLWDVEDTAANLIADITDGSVTGAANLDTSDVGSVELSVSEAKSLLGASVTITNGYTVDDTAANLVTDRTDGSVTGATAVTSDGSGAALSIADAKLLVAIADFDAANSLWDVEDTAANLVTDRTDGSVTGAAAVTSDGSGAALSIADAKLLVAIADFDAANSLWDVEDTAANLIADIADGSVTGAANLDTSDVGSVELSVSEAKSLLGASVTITNGYTVDDTAANLVTDRTDGSVTGATAVTSDGSGAALSIVDAKLLVAIADFDAANSLWDVEDTAANLIADITDGSVTGAANLDTSDVGSVELSVSEAKSLLGASVTITNGYTVDDTAANLVTDRTDGSVTGATAVTSDGSGAALSIADAKLLVAIADFDAANSLWDVEDTAANLVTDRTDGSVTGAAAVTSDGSGAALSIADAKLLVAIADFDAANSLWDVEDTAANLIADIADGSVTGAANLDTSDVGSVELSVSEAKSLLGASVTITNGYTVDDTAANLVTDRTDGSVTGATAVTSDGSGAALSIVDAKLLVAIADFDAANSLWDVEDTAANLIADIADGSVTGAANLDTSDVGSVELSVSEAKSLLGASVTITNGYTVDDTAANLVTDRTDGSVTGATAVTSDGSGAALSIADAKLLVAIADFDAANSLWDVEDTAANLVTDRTDGSVTGAAAVTSDGSGAALSIADAKLLVAIADFDAANSLWDVEDTAANLIADIADGSVTGAANLDTSDVGSVELSVSEAKSLLGASVTITNGYTVDDTAANLVTDRTDGSVTGATAVTSDGSGAALSIVDAKLLVAIADFDAANSLWDVEDTAANLIADIADGSVTGAANLDTSDVGSVELSVSEAKSLLGASVTITNGYTVDDTAANLVTDRTDGSVTGAHCCDF